MVSAEFRDLPVRALSAIPAASSGRRGFLGSFLGSVAAMSPDASVDSGPGLEILPLAIARGCRRRV